MQTPRRSGSPLRANSRHYYGLFRNSHFYQSIWLELCRKCPHTIIRTNN
nr:MAG TPA: hypothetical protein [Caudoviricetes sp.]